jgi:hypothetical protein
MNSDTLEISVCSNARLNAQQFDELKKHVNYIVWCEKDLGHQDGTTAQANGAIYPLWQNDYIKTITHTDADAIILNERYFFGNAQILLDSGKYIMTSGPTYVYEYWEDKLYKRVNSHPCTFTQFGSMFVLNVDKFKETKNNYWPFIIRGHFETDRYTWFEECGLSVKDDAIMLPRLPHPNGMDLGDIDMMLGIFHFSNAPGSKKLRYMRLTCYDAWEEMVW